MFRHISLGAFRHISFKTNMKLALTLAVFLKLIINADNCGPVVRIPIVINTWGFSNATIQAWDVLQNPEKSAVS